MKIKDGYILREVASSNIVVPVGKAQMNFNGVMTLNSVGTLIWHALEEGATREELVKKVTDIYDIDEQTAGNDIDIYIKKLKEKDMVED